MTEDNMTDNMNLDDEKKKIYDFVSTMPLYDADFDVLVSLLSHMDDTLFVKAMEEVMDGTLTLSDFKPLFSDTRYSDVIAESLSDQESLFQERKELLANAVALNELNTSDKMKEYNVFLQMLSSNGSPTSASYPAVLSEKAERIYEILTSPTGNPYDDFIGNLILKDFMNGTISPDAIDGFLLSRHDYLLPVDYRHVTLTDDDLRFAADNKITTEQMKKMKSMKSYYMTQREIVPGVMPDSSSAQTDASQDTVSLN